MVFHLISSTGGRLEVENEIVEFEKWCKKSWGRSKRDIELLFTANTPQIRHYKDFKDMKAPLKMHIAEKLIFESCSRVGAYIDTGDVRWYIHNFAKNLQGNRNIAGFGGRVTQPLIAALLLIACEQFSSALPSDRSDFDHICAGGASLSAMYLMARLENLFRIKSQYLNEDGTLKKGIPKQLRQLLKKYGVNRIGNNWRCNRINQSFMIFLYRNKTSLAKQLRLMDRKLKIANRLDYIRNPVMHGELEDPSSEARFLGLLIAMFYYGA
jgi:hypothetical protein